MKKVYPVILALLLSISLAMPTLPQVASASDDPKQQAGIAQPKTKKKAKKSKKAKKPAQT
ncbi:conserved exported hypothetical protein [Desulfarculales bacterium]